MSVMDYCVNLIKKKKNFEKRELIVIEQYLLKLSNRFCLHIILYIKGSRMNPELKKLSLGLFFKNNLFRVEFHLTPKSQNQLVFPVNNTVLSSY